MEQDKKKKVDKEVTQNKTGKTATGKPKNPIELNPQLKYDDTGGLRQEAIVLTAPDLDEGKALTIAQRQKRARIFKRNLPKIERAREMAKRRQASSAKIQSRAEKAAREILKKRFAGRKGTPYAELSVSEKIQVDKKLEGKANLIKKIAMRLLPKVRRAEYERLRSYYKGEPMKSLHQEPSTTVNEAFETMLGVFSTEDKSTIKKMVEQSQPEDLVDIIENMIDDLAKEGNPLVETLRGMLDKVAPKNPIYEAIQRKAEGNCIPFEIIEEVFNRGLDAWDGKRGTQEQYAFDRVNSYISHGKAYDLDADLREARADVKRTKVRLPDGRVVWRSYRKSTEVEKRDASDAMEESKNTPYVKPFYGSSDNTKQSGWKASNKHGKVKYFGNDFKASAHKHAGINEGDDCTDPMKRQEGTDSLTKKYKKQTPGQKTNEQFASFFESMHKKYEDDTSLDVRKEIEYTKRGKPKSDEKDETELQLLRRRHTQVKKKIIDEAIIDIDEAAAEGLAAKAKKSGISIGVLRKVYNRGMAAWKTGHRPGTTPQQWGMARVNSYITKGKGTYHGADKDLREVAKLDERNKENAMKRKTMDASRGARYKLNNPVPDADPKYKNAQAHNKAIGRALRNEDSVEEGYLGQKGQTGRDYHNAGLFDKDAAHGHAKRVNGVVHADPSGKYLVKHGRGKHVQESVVEKEKEVSTSLNEAFVMNNKQDVDDK